MATATKVQTEETTIEELVIGSIVKHKGDWVPVRKIVPSDIFEDQLAIYTPKGLLTLSYPFETIDVAI